ncbi:hypothetical protein Glove_33g92 [Diversispora epigaea]|uniref:Uncharacterized protein n=1 Tax=Diversispora epigaea TaxID=1348612 RepID=A0A397JGS0_9GLOM|nr:hypothetical protein Glove_33g92 [Diversispora epigaea]
MLGRLIDELKNGILKTNIGNDKVFGQNIILHFNYNLKMFALLDGNSHKIQHDSIIFYGIAQDSKTHSYMMVSQLAQNKYKVTEISLTN